MERKNRSITDRIKRCKNDQKRFEIALQWMDNWKAEQSKLCEKLSTSARINDYDEACICTGQLRAVTEKKFAALNNISDMIGLPETEIAGLIAWGNHQRYVITDLGACNARSDWNGIARAVMELSKINRVRFAEVKEIISAHQSSKKNTDGGQNPPHISHDRQSDIDCIINTYHATGSLNQTAAECGINWQKVRKVLITSGEYESDIARTVSELKASGLTDIEIATRMKISVNAVNSYLPYEKGIYKSNAPSENALAIRMSRSRPPVINGRKEWKS